MCSNKENEPISASLLAQAITEPLSIRVESTLDSTSLEAKRMVRAGKCAPTLIVAEAQTSGRGRLGRAFYSPPNCGVYLTVLYPLDTPLTHAVSVTGAASVAVFRAIRRAVGVVVGIKWVNDLYWQNRKICGILTEAVTDPDGKHYLSVGIGLNLYPTEFPEELADKAGSLGAIKVSRNEMIAAIVNELMPFLKNPFDRSWLADYRRYSIVIGEAVMWIQNGEARKGIAVGINDDGELITVSPDGETTVLRTGEISLRL